MTIINDRYEEPKNELTIGSFLSLPAVKTSERKVQAENDKLTSKSKKKKIPKKTAQDIRAFFKSAEMNGNSVMMKVKSIYESRTSQKNVSNEPIITD